MKRGKVGLCVLLGATAVASTAYAQVTSDRMVQGRQPRTFSVALQGAVEHDTNLPRVSSSLAAAQNLVREDTIFTPTAKIDALLPVGRQVIFMQGSVSYLFHDKNKRLDSDRIALSGGVGNVLGPCGTVIGGAYNRGRSELQNRELLSTVDNILEVKSIQAQLTCTRPPSLGFTGSVSHDWASNSSSMATATDYETTTATAGINFSQPTLGSLALQGNYAKTEYKKSASSPPSPIDGFESIGAGLRVERKLGGRIQAIGTVSYQQVNVASTPLPPPFLPVDVRDFSGLTYSAELSFRASSRLQARATFDRKVVPTLLAGRGFEIETNYSGRIDYRIGTRIALGLNAEQRDSHVRGGTAVVPANAITDSRLRSGGAALRYEQSKRISVTLTGQVEERTADNRMFNYTSERVGLSTEVKF